MTVSESKETLSLELTSGSIDILECLVHSRLMKSKNELDLKKSNFGLNELQNSDIQTCPFGTFTKCLPYNRIEFGPSLVDSDWSIIGFLDSAFNQIRKWLRR